jgi:hypothetical protein
MPKDILPFNTKKRGRPKKYASAAERQRAYRQRLQARGLRVQARVVRTADAPLRSDVIDLGACRRW